MNATAWSRALLLIKSADTKINLLIPKAKRNSLACTQRREIERRALVKNLAEVESRVVEGRRRFRANLTRGNGEG